ncbi:PucR family transcriptional regulator ligand-binding domain-containing protein [Priestia filamentosa]|nr:PucR family transcriptional regulator ligand-binding domain-containing protein [Priestia filamentosa]
MQATLTVSELLKRKNFEHCEVVAGKEGLERRIKWIHIVEVPKVEHLLKGEELILSTGVGWKENEEAFSSLLQQLITRNVAGLCIEIGSYTKSIPSSIINLANKHKFPLILFHQEVPFVEITQDVHTFMINAHYEILARLRLFCALRRAQLTFSHLSNKTTQSSGASYIKV